VPDIAKDTLPWLVSAVSVPPTRPVCVGVNVSGTWIVWPAVSCAGSAGVGVPTVNCEELDVSFVSVRLLVAVSVRVFVLLLEIVVTGKLVAGPVSGGVTGEPNPRTLPSRVPT
jgi:hypothetical protein